jgi:small GTP-binding protein domain
MLDNLFELIDFSIVSHSNDNTDCSIVIVGMPNVGKSSLLNSLIQKEQAIVSDIAGTTRDSVDTIIKWHGKDIKIIDTAGLRKKSKVDTDIEFYSSLRAMDSLLRSDLVLLVVDAEKGFTKQEKTIAKEVIKKGKRMVILVNKWDLASGTNVSAELYKEDMYAEFKDLQHYPILFVSALTKRRVSNILEKAWETFNKQKEKLSTKDLNDWIEKAVKNYPPPATQGKSIKVKFVEQVQQSPPIFALFSKYPKLISVQYLRYLHNQLRES